MFYEYFKRVNCRAFIQRHGMVQILENATNMQFVTYVDAAMDVYDRLSFINTSKQEAQRKLYNGSFPVAGFSRITLYVRNSLRIKNF